MDTLSDSKEARPKHGTLRQTEEIRIISTAPHQNKEIDDRIWVECWCTWGSLSQIDWKIRDASQALVTLCLSSIPALVIRAIRLDPIISQGQGLRVKVLQRVRQTSSSFREWVGWRGKRLNVDQQFRPCKEHKWVHEGFCINILAHGSAAIQYDPPGRVSWWWPILKTV